ncbi:hypothetical protein GCM10010172_06940 [Paractinoplanes ferrugineus]|uniref:Uncharacterized protein n=1 Tax=Paractinoplanes ferrugineus TaxID=113564 RepID=A0A919MHX4_9ACTN|nr:hypothetical protein [Actinoplanes ferrugineus]GIE16278.1 hypothetical protein Afe05nite_81180 [Actinoplanes ferrugineus]
MTQVAPARLKSDMRWGQIYGVDVIDHESWMAGTPVIVPNDYVGQSRQKLRARENQHRDTQAFSDLIVGSPRVLWEGWCTDDELDERERQFIQDVPLEQRPRLNYMLNDDNPRRIEKWRLVEQRHARDDRNGVPRWEPTPYRPEAYGYRAPRVSVSVVRDRQVRGRGWTRGQKQLAGWAAGWAVTTVALWVVELFRPEDVRWWIAPAVAAELTGFVRVWSWLGFPLRPRTWRRQWRKKTRRRR